MPIEFSVAAFRLGHSMIRSDYNWNSHFPGTAGSLDCMFIFSALGGDLGGERRLLSSWIADWRRMYDFPAAGKPGLAAPDSGVNMAMRIDTRLTNPLASLPPSTFGGDENAPADAAQPGLPQPHPRQHGQARQRAADGDQAEERRRQRRTR